jgi:pimeloyl-ACP methyl ester carboxylesterase/DNA-binding winged helix-turn-helix (wHTH) protein
MHSVNPKTLHFETYTLDLQCCSLLCGRDEVRLRPKSFDVLRYLAEHTGRVVSKEELVHAIWPDVVVTDDSVVQCIADIRAALRDDARRIIKTVPRRGYLFAAELTGETPNKRSAPIGPSGQEITFCRTSDGVNLAMACVGQGFPLVMIPTWLTHLEHDWQSPHQAQLLRFLSDRFQVIRYDCRGFGLSDREVREISFATFQSDLKTVVDALGLYKYALLGISQGGPTAISHAARYPDSVSKLVLHGSFALGRRKRRSSKEAQMATALAAILRHGLSDEESVFLRLFSSIWYPNASADQMKWYVDLLRTSTSADVLARNRSVAAEIDVLDLLPKVAAPTLVLHCRRDNAVPFEEGRRVATSLPKAKFVSLDAENHVPLPGEAAWQAFINEIEAFLSN